MYKKLFSSFKSVFALIILSGLTVVAACTTNSIGYDSAITTVNIESLSIMQGFTTDSTTQFNVLAPKNSILKYFIRAESNVKNFSVREIEVQRYEKIYSDWAVDKIKVSGLKINHLYTIEVRDDFGKLIDSREFKTINIFKSRFKFAAVSCLDDFYEQAQEKIWPELLAKSPEYIFMLGDNVYATKNAAKSIGATPEQLWHRYVETRIRISFYHASQLIPVIAIWDDHDFGKDQGDIKYKYKSQSEEVFNIFYSQEPDNRVLESGPGIAASLSAFQQRFYFMDNRSFRSPNNSEDKNQTHWGKSQERWLFEGLKVSPVPTWIINGDQFYGAYHRFESYAGSHPKNFIEFENEMSKINTPFILISGDRHLIEFMEINNQKLKTFEITTSGLHAKLYPNPWISTPNPHQIDGRSGVFNYVIIESENIKDNLHARVTAYTINNEILFHRYFRVNNNSKPDRTLSY